MTEAFCCPKKLPLVPVIISGPADQAPAVIPFPSLFTPDAVIKDIFNIPSLPIDS